MSGSTTELGLRTAIDGDDNADYLTIDLANSLRILDALLSNVTGHNHAGAHQGGPLTVSTAQLADASVTTPKIADGAVTTSKLGDGQVTSVKIADGTIVGADLAAGAVSDQAVGGDLMGTVGAARLSVQTASRITWRDAGGTEHPVISFGGEQLNWAATGGGFRWVNQGNSVQWMALDTAGNLTAAGQVAGNTVTSTGRITAGSDLVVGAGNVYLTAGDTAIIRVGADNVRLPTTVWFGAGVNDTYIQRNAVGSWVTNSNVGINGALFLGAAPQIQIVKASATALRIVNADLNLDAPRVLSLGDCAVNPGTNIGKGNTVYLTTHCYVGFDLSVGHDVHADGGQMFSTKFNVVSNPDLKSAMAVIPPADALATVLDTRVQSYSFDNLPEPEPPPGYESDVSQAHTKSIGFSAAEMVQVVPQVVSLNEAEQPAYVDYPALVSLLWSAVRQLDARLAAKGI